MVWQFNFPAPILLPQHDKGIGVPDIGHEGLVFMQPIE